MLWLIPYVGWTLAASAVASAAGYAAVTQFSVIQRVLALALQRALSKLAKSEDGISTYNVEHTDTGKAVFSLSSRATANERLGGSNSPGQVIIPHKHSFFILNTPK